MAITLPVWAIGKHITSCLLTPQTINTTTGVMTDTTPTLQFYGQTQNIELEIDNDLENISAMDRPYKNMVIIESGAKLTLTEYEKSAGTNFAAAAAFGATHWKYTLVRGAQTFIGYGVLEKYSMNAPKQAITAQLVLAPIDTGTSTAPIVYG